MSFASLKCSGFRNLNDVDIDFSEKFVVFTGPNGSGKTSLLEALYFLTHSRSFRVSSLKKLVCHESDSFSLFSRLFEEGVPLGVERDLSGRQRVRYDGETISSISKVAQLVPLQFLDTDAHRLLASSPSNRRKFLDWGVFHVEQSFASDWQIYQKVLKHRNTLLKQGGNKDQLDAWTSQLADCGERITSARSRYIEKFESTFKSLWQDLMPAYEVPELSFDPGWDGCGLAEALYSRLDVDRRYGYTTAGPHRSDLLIKQKNISIFDFFSQGQQKSLMYALKVSQGLFLKKEVKKDVVYLIDDLPAELDQMRLSLVLDVLKQHASQVFITAIEKGSLDSGLSDSCQYFSISHGNVDVC
jgi:DNA replication and repair protein RecF